MYRSDYFLELNSCGRQYLSDRDHFMCREKGRDDYHILYITNGCCHAEADGEQIDVHAGQMLLFKPFEKQVYRFYAADESVSCFIHFSGTQCEDLLSELGISDRVTNVGLSHTLQKIFTEMRDEYRLERPFKKQVCSALLLRFLAGAAQHIKYNAEDININYKKRMDEICNCMHKNYKKNIPVEFYAKMCSLSADRFTHAFKESVGVSPKKYMLQAKVNASLNLLENTDLNICEIAEYVGISDANYFTRLIKRYTGHTPKYFRT